MDRMSIVGGRPLNGTIPISGAKNAALPLMIASLLTPERLTLKNVPSLADVAQLGRILRNHGVDLTIDGKRGNPAPHLGETGVGGGAGGGCLEQETVDLAVALLSHPDVRAAMNFAA